jgi:peptidoglycan/LPS O-acetylase OafA/YrhL
MIRSFEGLRGIAALLVALYHFGVPNAQQIPFLRSGWLWVDIFLYSAGL